MQAKITRSGDVTVVQLSGFMNFETIEPFRKTCFQALLAQKIVFDLKNLNFIGSSGLTSFVETLRDFRKANALPVKFSGLSSEFRRFFWANELADIEVYEDQNTAHASFYTPIAPIAIHFATEVEIVDETQEPISGDGEAVPT